MARSNRYLFFITITLLLVFTGCSLLKLEKLSKREKAFSFIVTADIHISAEPAHRSQSYFLEACQAIRKIGKGAFMVSIGDMGSSKSVFDIARKTMGEDYLWYPVIGNHDAENQKDMIWLRSWGRTNIQNLVRQGPENGEKTTYSFDYGDAHFVVLNEYYDGKSDTGTDGNIVTPLYNWLKNDLEANSKPFIFVFGHEPIISIPDYHNGRRRHIGDNLHSHRKNSHRFQQLMRKYKILAYICGHTHMFSYSKINGLWQLNAGHCRGIGGRDARSTFLKVIVGNHDSRVEVYRHEAKEKYVLTQTILLN